MVKNSTGGNKSRQQGRKFKAAGELTNTAVRRVREEGEMYAAVTRMFGGKFCQVVGTDGILRRCAIRKKFSQRRSQNNLTAGVWVLLGLYDWNNKDKDDASISTTCSCDLLEIYNPGEKERLKQLEKDCNFGPLLAVGETKDVSFSENNPHSKPAHTDDSDADHEDNEESDDDGLFQHNSIDSVKTPKEQLVPVSAPEYKKPTLQDQMDWINEDDI